MHDKLLTRDFVFLCLSTFLFAASMFLLFAVLPPFVIDELHGTETDVGLVMGAFAAAALLSRPGSGWLVEARSRKAGLKLGAVIYCVTPLLYMQAGSVPLMLALRLLHGIGIAAYTTAASVLVADLAPAGRRGEAMGYHGMALNLSLAVAPALGAVLMKQLGFGGLFWVSSAVALGSLLLVPLVREPQRPHPLHGQPGRGGLVLFSRAALFPAFIAMCMTTTFGAVVAFLPLFVQEHDLGNPGLFFTVYAAVVVASRPWAGRWSDRIGRAAVAAPGMVSLGIAMVTLAYTTSTRGLLCAALFQGFGFGTVHPAMMALTVDRATPAERGAALATLMAAFDVGVGLSATVLGAVLARTDFTTTYLCTGAVAFSGAAACAWGARREAEAPV